MSYGLAFGFPRNNTLAAAASPFTQLGPTLDLIFAGAASSGEPTAGLNDSLDLNFIGNQYSVGAPYMVWGGTGMTAENFQDIVTFSRATGNATYTNSSGYLTTAGVLNYLTYSNQADNAAWTKSNSFVQTNLLLQSQTLATTWIVNNVSVNSNVAVAPDGTLTADEIVCTANSLAYLVQGLGAFSTYSSTLSVYLKVSGTDRGAVLNFQDDTGGVDIYSLTIPSLASGGTDVGNGWRRYSVTGLTPTPGNVASVRIYVDKNGTGVSGVSRLYAWGAQLVQGSVPGDYVATTSAALPVLYADYNGVVRARKVSVDAATTQHRIHQVTTVVASTPYTESIYVKAGEYSKVALREGGLTGSYASFNLATGTLLDQGAGGVGFITSIGNGWYRISMASASGGVTFRSDVILLEPSYTTGAVTNAYAGDGSSGIYISNAQLEPGSVLGPYFDTTQYPYNAPRFDYDPVTLAARGLLIEEQRTNLLLQSNDFQTSWNLTNVTRTLNATLSPDGNVNGVKLEATTAVATLLYQGQAVAATAATGSVYVKQGTGATVANEFTLRNATTSTTLVAGTLNYSTGVFTYTVGSTGVVVTNIGNGWWKIALTATSGITSSDIMRLYVGFAGGAPAAGDFLYAYGAQLEAGAFATSYIPTVASQVTRAADVASVNTLTPWYNPAAGTFYFEGDTAVPASLTLRNLTNMTDGTVNNVHRTYLYNGTVGGSTTTGGVTQADIGGGSYTVNTAFKFAYAATVNSFAAVLNGGAPTTDALGTMPSGLTTFEIASQFAGTVNTGHIRRISYYPRRLSNTELQTLTTL